MAVVLGLVQGVAEFLPISSSGHLTLLQHFFGVEEVDNLFNILLHFATLIAVCAVYWKDIVDMIAEFFRALAALFTRRGGRQAEGVPPARRLVLLVILGTLPLFLVLPLDDKVEALGSSPVFVACMLLVTGFILFFSDRMAKGRKTERTATVKDALLVGLAQAVATIPGLSRSGCTISAGMALGFDRKFAVRYSFLLSLPAVLGATLLKVVHAVGDESMDLTSIQLVNLLAQKNKFGRFAYYCWAAGLVALAASFLMK
jgi:undecaprenyl-diphosphatase